VYDADYVIMTKPVSASTPARKRMAPDPEHPDLGDVGKEDDPYQVNTRGRGR